MIQAEVGRFLIRDLAPWEGARVFALTGDAEVTKYMGFRTCKTVDESSNLILAYGNSPTKFQAVCEVSTPGDILGIIGLEVRGHQACMTIMFRRDWKARGAGREFSVPFVKWIFTHPSVWRVWAVCHVDNIAVQRVLERMGAEREGRLRRYDFFPNISDEPQDVFIYAIVR